MIRTDTETISRVVNAMDRQGDASTRISGVSIDSRSIGEGNLFVAIVGKSNDGHDYIDDAVKRGAAALIVNAEYKMSESAPDVPVVVVEDTLEALLALGEWWLKKFDTKKIAITGTNGKTTTKEMIASILSRAFSVYRSPGNFNNLYGIPLSIFEMDGEYDYAVFEFGMSTPGEIARLTQLVQPEFGLITNIAAAHLETMLSVDAIAAAKFELFDNMPEEGTVFMNLDNDYLRRRFDSETRNRVGFSIKSKAGFAPDSFSMNGSGCARFEIAGIGEIHLKTPGLHGLYNAVAAAALANHLNVPGSEIKAALEDFKSVGMRMETFTTAGIFVINDSYNANPVSMKFALDTLMSMKTDGRKYAVLGDMFELGKTEIDLHREVGVYVSESNPDYLITYGDRAREISMAAVAHGYPADNAIHFEDMDKLTDYLLDHLQAGDAVLVKASRGMAFDRITTGLQTQLGRQS